MKIEFWLPVFGYENLYEINQFGMVRSIPRVFYDKKGRKVIVKGRIYSSRIDKRTGYLSVKLTKNGKQSTRHIHRLLALTFIPNPFNKCCVNHKDGNKLNNSLDNLEWVSHAENNRHAYLQGLKKPSHAKKVKDECTGKILNSIKEAAEYIGIPYKTFQRYITGNRPNPTCLRLAA